MPKRILVIDDDPDILEILDIIFKQEGYEVILSASGEAADHLAEISPDLVLLDIRISGTGNAGADICARIKSSPETKDLPVYMFSAEDKIREISESCGANGYFCKPFKISNLITKVNELFAA